MKTLSIVMIITIFAIGVSSCAGNSSAGQPDLEGATWVLTSYNESQPIEGTQLTIQFEDGRVSGNAGCNHYGGSYQIKGDVIVFTDLFNTERACMEPKGVMEQEQIYIDLLRVSQRFELVDGVLTIFANPQQFLTFEIHQANLIKSTPASKQPSPLPPTSIAEILKSTPTLVSDHLLYSKSIKFHWLVFPSTPPEVG